MSWINKNRKIFRLILLALLVAAIVGPWFFDEIYVPAEYECQAPNMRLNEKLCGVPLSGIWILSTMVRGFIYAGKTLVAGSMPLYELRGELFFSVFLFLILLPFFSTLLLILFGERRALQVFNAAALGLALGLCLLIGLSTHPNQFWVLWGVWLYIAVAAAALSLEILVIRAGKSTSA